ncbi:MAG: acetate/propionate family kinase [Alphaproteobacteria bacterium]|nr:acetate/propionate family kinase [Alphaproteobacteria bacterium]MBV8413074.1 acetate/propionate family kinase [Alphaproteobacteria bacterium]
MSTPGAIAVLNAGSSSIKFALYEATPEETLLFRGQIESIGLAPHLKVADAAGAVVGERRWPDGKLDHREATNEILKVGRELLAGRPVLAFGHRVVHGGVGFTGPVRIDRAVMDELAKLVPLAPLHQPHNLAPIEAIAAASAIPQVACFDTAFHRSQPALAQAFGLPRDITAAGVRRYGFHGLSYDFIVSRLRQLDPALARQRLVIAHLGNGASACAVHEGLSVASTMGFTAVDGLMMGTRTGALDPGVLLWLLDERGYDSKAIEDLLYRKSGLLGVSGLSSDMRTLRQSAEPAAREAIALFVYRIVREVGSLAAALGGLEGLVFTAGIGENDAATRAEVGAGCSWLGVTVDPSRNAAGRGVISSDASRVKVLVLPTDEERMIARYTGRTLGI